MCCANAGMHVTIVDINQAALERGMNLVDKNYARSRRISKESRKLIEPTTDYERLSSCDLVVEAVFESMEIKKQIFARLDRICKQDAFLCSNTSALDIDEIASVCSTARRPQIMGTHFFSPANVMPLLENVRGKHTSDVTLRTMMSWGAEIGKWCILVGNCHGFCGNRIVGLYTDAARRALHEGSLPEEVDAAAEAFGFRMGPFRMADLVGLDLGIQAMKRMAHGRQHPSLSTALWRAAASARRRRPDFTTMTRILEGLVLRRL